MSIEPESLYMAQADLTLMVILLSSRIGDMHQQPDLKSRMHYKEGKKFAVLLLTLHRFILLPQLHEISQWIFVSLTHMTNFNLEILT